MRKMQLFGHLLVILTPVFSELRPNLTVYGRTGESVILFCNVTPNSQPCWDYYDQNYSNFAVLSDELIINPDLPNTRNLEIFVNNSMGNYNLQITKASINEEGLYVCSFVKRNDLWIESNSYVVELKIKVPPSNITIHDANTGILHGTENYNLVLKCSVISGTERETIMWFNDSLLLGIGGPGTFELNINPQKYDHGRIYTCVVNSTAFRSSLKKNVQLDITYKPYITFNKGKRFIIVNETQSLTVSCKVDSNPIASTIVWAKCSQRYHLKTRDSTLDLFNISRNDAGIYECRASNTIGYGNDSTEIIVQYKPVFESQNEHIQNGISGMEIDIRVSVYSYPMINIVKVRTREFSSIEHEYIDIENATDIDGKHSKSFPVNAFIITLHGFVIEENDFTSYTFWIANSVGDANYTVKLVDAEKHSGRSLNIYWQISSSFFGGLLLGIACFVFWGFYQNKSRKNGIQQVHQEIHYDEIELADNNPSSPTHRNYRPVDAEIVLAQAAESENSGSENPGEAKSSDEISTGSVSVPRELHDYENSYQPLELDNTEKHLYDETQVLCSTSFVSTENTYVNTVL